MNTLDVLIAVLIIVLIIISQMRNNEKFSTNNIDSCLNNCPGFDPNNPLLFDEVNNEFDVLTWMNKCQNDYTGTPSDAEQGCEHTLRCIRNCYPVQQ